MAFFSAHLPVDLGESPLWAHHRVDAHSPVFPEPQARRRGPSARGAYLAAPEVRVVVYLFVPFRHPRRAHQHTCASMQTRTYLCVCSLCPFYTYDSRVSAILLVHFFPCLIAYLHRFLAVVIPGGAYLIPVSLRTDPATEDPSLYALRNDGTASPAAVGTLGIKNALPPEMREKTMNPGAGGGRGRRMSSK